MVDRRTVLSVLAGAGVVASAGCLDAASDVRDSFSGSGDSSTPLFERWLPAPSGRRYADGLVAVYVDLESVRSLEGTLPESAVTELKSYGPEPRTLTPLGTNVERVDASLSVSPGSTLVLTGSFDESAVGNELESLDPVSTSEYEGFDVYRAAQEEWGGNVSHAVDSSTILRTSLDRVVDRESSASDDEDPASDGESGSSDGSGTDERPAIERLIDTGVGNRDRHQDVDDDVATVLESVESPTYLLLSSGSIPEDALWMAAELSITDDRTTGRYFVLFEDDSIATEDRIRSIATENGFADSFDDVAYDVDGRLVTAEGSTATANADFLGEGDDQERAASPQAGVHFDQSDGTVTVRITAIDRVDELRIRRDDEVVEVLEDPEVGDGVTVEASSGDTITVSGTYEGEQAVIAEYDA